MECQLYFPRKNILILRIIVVIVVLCLFLIQHFKKLSFNMKTTHNLSSHFHKSFASEMRSFPWKHFQLALNKIKRKPTTKNLVVLRNYSEALLNNILLPFIIKDPLVPINTSCFPPSHLSPTRNPGILPKCTYLSPNKSKRKLGVIFNFGFDVDALEVHLHELDSLVDFFFLMEGTRMHKQYMDSKPSIWSMLKHTPRFSKFRNKIVHFILDDTDYTKIGEIKKNHLPKEWERERLQSEVRLQKFFEWNNYTGHFGPNDLIGIGDVDEIPSRDVVNFLKHCEIDQDGVVDIGIWFPVFGDMAFASDFPVDGHKYTLAHPTYFTLDRAKELLRTKVGHGQGKSSEASGKNRSFLLGGMHFSNHPYLPFQMAKFLAASENGLSSVMSVIKLGMLYLTSMSDKLEIHCQNEDERADMAALEEWGRTWVSKISNINRPTRILSLVEFLKDYGDEEVRSVVRVPWFVECNRERFRAWERKRDYRLN